MPLRYKIITAMMAVTGCSSLLISGEINPLMALGGVAAVPGYYRLFKGREAFPKRSVSLLASLALSVFLFDVLIVSAGDILLGVAHLTIVFQAVKSFDLGEPWDYLQVYFVSLLQLVVASALTQSAVFGVIFLFFSFVLVLAMIYSHYIREGRSSVRYIKAPVSIILLLTFVLTAIFFVALPRGAFKVVGRRGHETARVSGFSDRVEFGDLGRMKLDPTVIMRIWLDRPVSGQRYWRGLAFDYFDGMVWKNSGSKKEGLVRNGEEYVVTPHEKGGVIREDIVVEPSDAVVIFGLDERKSIRIERRGVLRDGSDNLYLSRPSSGQVSYTVTSSFNDSYPGRLDRRYLQLPAGMKRVVNLAGRITAVGRSERERASLIEQYLRKNYRYSLNAGRPAPGVSPVEDFLFNTQTGYCQHYATAMVLMLRGVGIPARIVTGFSGGEYNAYGGYVILRQSDAHSWVEALLGHLWVRFDPTPPSSSRELSLASLVLDSMSTNWSRYVVGFSAADQKTIAHRLAAPFGKRTGHKEPSRPGPLSFLLAAIMLLGYVTFIFLRNRRRKRPHSFVTEQYLVLTALLKKRGMMVGPAATPGDLRRMSSDMNAGGKIGEFITLYEHYRFGGKTMDPHIRGRYMEILRKLLKEGKP